jgi:hypothetical protein
MLYSYGPKGRSWPSHSVERLHKPSGLGGILEAPASIYDNTGLCHRLRQSRYPVHVLAHLHSARLSLCNIHLDSHSSWLYDCDNDCSMYGLHAHQLSLGTSTPPGWTLHRHELVLALDKLSTNHNRRRYSHLAIARIDETSTFEKRQDWSCGDILYGSHVSV